MWQFLDIYKYIYCTLFIEEKIPFGGGACRSFLSFSILLITWNKFYVCLGCQRVYCYVNYYFYYLLFVFPSDCIC